jgi:hypothetical protein
MNRASAYLVSLLAFSACGGEPPPPAVPPPSPAPMASEAPIAPGASVSAANPLPSSSAAAAPIAPPEPPKPGQWDSWTKDQKLAYMKTAVMPKMGAMFHEFDPKTFSEPRCGLCHGPGAKDLGFKMPNPTLPKLPSTPDGFKKVHDQKPEIFDFMAKHVEPTMASLLGEQPYDPTTQKGFGCFDCHTKK